MEVEGLWLAPIFGNGMVLQRNSSNCIYGIETIEKTVILTFCNHQYVAKVSDNKEFSIILPPVEDIGPYTMTIQGSSTIYLEDILFGDVYLLAGQSNMELPIRRVLDVSGDEIKQTKEPLIRQYLLPATYQFDKPKAYMYESNWERAEGDSLQGFSALGYFFAKEIKNKVQAPMGLILGAVGGSKIESWMNEDSVKKFHAYEDQLEDFYDINNFHTYIQNQQEKTNTWLSDLEELDILPAMDNPSMDNQSMDNQSMDNEYKNWHSCQVPFLISDYSNAPFYGSIYVLKEVVIAEEQQDEAMIYMGTIIDSDRIWINGTLVGRTEYRYPPRKYHIPKGIIKQGKNTILIRLVINNGNGGFIKGRPYYLLYNQKQIDLTGTWYYKIGKEAIKSMPESLFPPCLSTVFYNTVISPLSKISLKGVLWYQGESNTHDPTSYALKFEEMLNSWRDLWGNNIPCIYVQLPNYREPLHREKDSGWAQIRQEQYKCLKIPNVGMAVALDLGEYNDLHPQNKKGIAKRMANVAMSLIYGDKSIAHSGPMPNCLIIYDNKVHIEFEHLEDNDKIEELNNFEVAGEDGIFYHGVSVRHGGKVIVYSDKVKKPEQIRYAWCDNPEEINFYNEHGLPTPGFSIHL